MKNKCNMLGRTMFETIAAISVMGLITMGVVKLTSSIMNRYKLSRISQQVVDIQKAINFRFMASANGYMGRENEGATMWRNILVEENLVPGEMKVAKGSNEYEDYGRHAFGGKIYVGPVEKGEGENKQYYQYYILFENSNGDANKEVWQQACTALADMKWLQDGTSSLVAHCFGECGKNNSEAAAIAKSLPSNDENACRCSFQTPADENAVEKCTTDYEDLSILWVFE